jgi:hypothetical protein
MIAACTSGRRRSPAVAVSCVKSAGARIFGDGAGREVRCGFWASAAESVAWDSGGVMSVMSVGDGQCLSRNSKWALGVHEKGKSWYKDTTRSPSWKGKLRKGANNDDDDFLEREMCGKNIAGRTGSDERKYFAVR